MVPCGGTETLCGWALPYSFTWGSAPKVSVNKRVPTTLSGPQSHQTHSGIRPAPSYPCSCLGSSSEHLPAQSRSGVPPCRPLGLPHPPRPVSLMKECSISSCGSHSNLREVSASICFSIHSVMQILPLPNFNTFPSLCGEPGNLGVIGSPCSPPQPSKPPVCFPSLRVCLFRVLPGRGPRHDLALCDRLLFLSVMCSRFVCGVACVSGSFLFVTKSCSTVWMVHNCFVRSSVGGLLGCFHLLAVANNAVNVRIHAFV